MQEARHEDDEGKQAQLLEDAREAADFLKTYVVQAQLNERGNFGMSYNLDLSDICNTKS